MHKQLIHRRLGIFSNHIQRKIFQMSFSQGKATNGSKILHKSALAADEAKFTKLCKIDWQDPCKFSIYIMLFLSTILIVTLTLSAGRKRVWESAERSTRGSGGIDGMLMYNLI